MGEHHHQPPPPPDAALTKVFVGGLAWETQKDALCDHFIKFGQILEAVVISDKISGRSKGYGFVTFKEADSAKRACEDTAPVINGRKANCNIAYLGARRGAAGKISPPATPAPLSPYTATAGSGRPAAVPWYFSSATSPSSHTVSPFQQHYSGVVVPFYGSTYGYSPSFVAPTNMSYGTNMPKPNHSGAGGPYLSNQYSYSPQGGAIVGPYAVAPVYHPMYQFHQHLHNHRLPHNMGNSGMSPAQFIPATTAGSGTVRVTHTSNLPAVVPVASVGSHTHLASAEAF